MFKKSNYINLEFNGFKWFGFEKGIHSFSKKDSNGKFILIQCEEIQLTNGDIEFMTEHNISLSKERLLSVKRNFISAGDNVEFIKRIPNPDKSCIVKFLDIPIYGIWDGTKVEFDDNQKHVVRNTRFLKKV